MIKKIILLSTLLFISLNTFGKGYDESKPIWDQYQNLYCVKNRNLVCGINSCKSGNSNLSFELDFKKNQMIYLGGLNINFDILNKFFHTKDSTAYSKVVNTLTMDGVSLQLFNFQKFSVSGKPEFISIETQVSLFPKTESDIETITSYGKCYPK